MIGNALSLKGYFQTDIGVLGRGYFYGIGENELAALHFRCALSAEEKRPEAVLLRFVRGGVFGDGVSEGAYRPAAARVVAAGVVPVSEGAVDAVGIAENVFVFPARENFYKLQPLVNAGGRLQYPLIAVGGQRVGNVGLENIHIFLQKRYIYILHRKCEQNKIDSELFMTRNGKWQVSAEVVARARETFLTQRLPF